MENQKENASDLYCRSLHLANLVDTATADSKQTVDAVVTAQELVVRLAMLSSMLDAVVGMLVTTQSELRVSNFPLAQQVDNTFGSVFQTIPPIYESYMGEVEMARRLNRSKAKAILAEENIDINDPEKVKQWIERQKLKLMPTKLENN